MMQKHLAALLFPLLFSACQQAPVQDEDSPDSRLSVGSQFIVNQVLWVPVGHTRVFMQHGQVVAKVKLDRYQPHCNLEVREVSEGDATIQPDTFTIKAVTEDEEEVVLAPSPLRRVWLRHGSDDMGMMMVTRFVRYILESASQPQVMRLTCHGGFDEPWRVKAPSVSDIRQALGSIATLRPAGAI